MDGFQSLIFIYIVILLFLFKGGKVVQNLRRGVVCIQKDRVTRGFSFLPLHLSISIAY
jgi:hypothetical protein